MPSTSPNSLPVHDAAGDRDIDWRPLVTCALATFLLLAFTTVVTVSAESIAGRLGAGFAVAQWIIDAYTLALAALVVAKGTLGDRLGHRRLFLSGLILFGVASAACATATSGGLLVAARAVQGVGGAAIFGTVVPLLTQHYHARARGIAFAVWGAVAGIGSTVGTIAGGAATQFITWRWLFLAALPICAAAVATGRRSLSRDHRATVRLDVPGLALITTMMTGATYAVINAGESGWASPGTIGAAAVSLAASGMFVRVQRRATNPLLSPDLFATRGFLAVLIAGFAYYFAAFAALPVLSRWLQSSAGMSPLRAALVLTVQLAAFVLVSLAFSARLHHAPRSWVLGGGTVLIGLACLTGAALLLRPSWTSLIAMLIVTGIGAAIVSPVLPAVAATSVPPARAGVAAAAANAARQLGLTIGIALCGTISQSAQAGSGPTTGVVVTALITSGAVGLCGGALSALLLRDRRPLSE
ncbi:MFS transporter [Mycolicibacterium peregrinum]|uniref:MFS transporter n=1 Tax=Mycolicibacterium peregrinum TaxID=43304 RepID=A0A4Z0HP93_MYCPR|nr:MFS transporter [Mycolicibacterium peregrinum]TGB42469.1 MFS transporter [Mycolicibacterium peregrinum]TGB43562.1 MFS transporter [Mycolicibacterium peregrinum]